MPTQTMQQRTHKLNALTVVTSVGNIGTALIYKVKTALAKLGAPCSTGTAEEDEIKTILATLKREQGTSAEDQVHQAHRAILIRAALRGHHETVHISQEGFCL